ncbi:MAG: hypothetical protein QOG78_4176 [Rhodospirillaceae bacterium]|nr:hypothetical protein [Rhodospirillaceae bacterium]
MGPRMGAQPLTPPSPYDGATSPTSLGREMIFGASVCALCRTADLNHRARAAVDVDGDAGDEGAGVRAEETGHARELL